MCRDLEFYGKIQYSLVGGYNVITLKCKTTFNPRWLEETDLNCHQLKHWSHTSAYCFICKKRTCCENFGLIQFLQHSEKKTTEAWLITEML